jgi:hypothetical protein
MPIRALALLLAIILLSGCAKEPPKCSEESTLSLVRQLVLEQIGEQNSLSDSEKIAYLGFDVPRATAFDEKIKKYSCQATLKIGDEGKLPISYESQLDDQGQHVVAISGLNRAELVGIKVSLAMAVRKQQRQGGAATPSPKENATGAMPDNITGSWMGQLEGGDGQLDITAGGPTGLNGSLGVSTAGCAGSIEGPLALAGKTLTLEKKAPDEACKITMKISGTSMTVEEGQGCSYYHGSKCSFAGSLSKAR